MRHYCLTGKNLNEHNLAPSMRFPFRLFYIIKDNRIKFKWNQLLANEVNYITVKLFICQINNLFILFNVTII